MSDFRKFSVRSLQQKSSALQNTGKTRFKENLGSLRRSSLSDEVNKDEPNTYEFRIRNRTTLKVELENDENLSFFDVFGTKKRVQATLFDSDQDKLKATDRIAPEDDDDFKIRLSPGTYSIRVTGRSENDVEYTLKLRTDSSGDFDDDDDSDDDD